MAKNILVVSATVRKGGNSEILAEEFVRGAEEAGNNVELLRLREMNLRFCVGCLYCQTHDKCAVHDSMNELYDRISTADILVFASPIYFYSVSGQLKTFLDRLNPLFPRKNRFKKVYLLATCADEQKEAMDGAIKDVQGWIDCFEGVEFSGVIYGIGVTNAGEIRKTDIPQEAYLLGKTLSE